MLGLAELKKMARDGQILPFNLALVHLGLGDRARTLDNLERGPRGRFADDAVDRSGCHLRSPPLRAALRGDLEEDGRQPLRGAQPRSSAGTRFPQSAVDVLVAGLLRVRELLEHVLGLLERDARIGDALPVNGGRPGT